MNPASPPAVRVLIAEDNLISRRVVAKMAELLGCAYVEVENGRDAVEACEAADYDLILMDIEMPEMDGLEAAAALRDRYAARGKQKPRIVAVTGEMVLEGVGMERYRQAGFDAWLGKPMKMEELQFILVGMCPDSGASWVNWGIAKPGTAAG